MSKSPRMIVAGNWKMNGDLGLIDEFRSQLVHQGDVEVVLCPPAVFLSAANSDGYALGAQDCSEFLSGAHTGDLSVQMLKELGCSYAIIGHSERRQDHNESNRLIGAKAKAVIENGLTPIVCVGEPLSVREAGGVFDYVGEQLQAVLDECGDALFGNAVIAYEPIWAIGTGKTATPEQAQEVHAFIRQELLKVSEAAQTVSILYGGSVKPDNAKTLFAQQDINGGLIGGASLQPESFIKICQAAN
ncbi:MAG: triose-phosphate isomerase [Pseudomonadota bacterium]